MKRLDLVSLRLFASIADARSLTAVATREHMALAAVSKRVRDLEAQLHTPLLYRRPRGVELRVRDYGALSVIAREMVDHLTRGPARDPSA